MFVLALLGFSSSTWAVAAAPIFTVSPPVQEVSGAVYDPARNAVWSMGDSGTGAVIGLTSLKDARTRLIPLVGAQNVDTEAVVLDERGHPWTLDVGDNNAVRKEVIAYELNPDAENSAGIPVIRALHFRYSDGPRNCEAAAIHDGRLYLFEKKYTGSARVASIDLASQAGDSQVTRPEGRIPALGPVTDAAVSPEGSVFLLTYLGIQRCDDCFSPTSRNLQQVRLGFRGQAETLIALSDDFFLVAAEEDGSFFVW